MQLSDILGDPNWFPVHFDLQKDTLTFLHTNRDKLSNGAFLDQRFYNQDDRFQPVRLSDALKANVPSGQPIHWIFHTAFCASTLMARALDVPGKVLALKEPDILMQLTNAVRMAHRNNQPLQPVLQLRDLILSLLARRFHPDEAILIKPTNPANLIIPDIMARGENALFMTSPLETFLISILRKGEEGAAFMRNLYNIFNLDGTGLSKISERDALRFTDMQIAALVWQHQHEDMTAAAIQQPSLVRAIEGLAFPEDRLPYMRAVSTFLGLSLTEADLQANAEGPVFAEHSKFAGQGFDTSAREQEIATLKAMHGDRLKATLDWQAKLDLGRDYKYLPAQSLLQ
ncbi:hypothetical protein RYZ27_04660 [Hyphomonas sp. FCG-A18]|uniref:hypothetical protein n=1 Tax=Hyphomonas sp. FCG-A18 TaxID=3080019 RepID=UPI002B29F6B8|nr:hypothetical protein RYZ27_04660 [Hyphomonas sp. FCG-A18]